MSYVLMCLLPESQALEFVFDSRGRISLDGGWETPILFSLGTNKRVPQVRFDNSQGWWGDNYPDERHPNDTWGSIIWIYFEQGVLTQTVARQVQTAAQASVKHFVDDGAASKISITVVITSAELLDIKVDMVRPDTDTFSKIWSVHINAL